MKCELDMKCELGDIVLIKDDNGDLVQAQVVGIDNSYDNDNLPYLLGVPEDEQYYVYPTELLEDVGNGYDSPVYFEDLVHNDCADEELVGKHEYFTWCEEDAIKFIIRCDTAINIYKKLKAPERFGQIVQLQIEGSNDHVLGQIIGYDSCENNDLDNRHYCVGFHKNPDVITLDESNEIEIDRPFSISSASFSPNMKIQKSRLENFEYILWISEETVIQSMMEDLDHE